MTLDEARCTFTGKRFDSKWADDGEAFMCSECGVSTRRTRMNPYPTMKHRAALQAKGGE